MRDSSCDILHRIEKKFLEIIYVSTTFNQIKCVLKMWKFEPRTKNMIWYGHF